MTKKETQQLRHNPPASHPLVSVADYGGRVEVGRKTAGAGPGASTTTAGATVSSLQSHVLEHLFHEGFSPARMGTDRRLHDDMPAGTHQHVKGRGVMVASRPGALLFQEHSTKEGGGRACTHYIMSKPA